jgi:hypothetical protein
MPTTAPGGICPQTGSGFIGPPIGDGLNAPAVLSVVAVALLATGGAPFTPTATDTVRIANTLLKCVFIYILFFNFGLSASYATGGLY